MDSVSFMVSRLLDKEVHHHLLNYEGLLAFTNLTSFESEIRIKIIECKSQSLLFYFLVYSVNDSINSLLYSENDEVGIAAIEFLANLSADSAMEKKFYSSKLKLYYLNSSSSIYKIFYSKVISKLIIK